MYVVRDKATQMVLLSDPRPVSPAVKARDIYADFDPATMELGWTPAADIPEYFRLGKDDEIVALTLEEQVAAGIIALQPSQKIAAGQIVEKSLGEQLAEGLIELQPHEKLEGGQIVEKSLEEQVREGVLVLAPDQKIEAGQIVDKSLEEQVAEGLLELQANEQLEGGQIVEKSLIEILQAQTIETREQGQTALNQLSKEIEMEIAQRYRSGYEMKIIKDYMAWIEAGKPSQDKRQQQYLDMQVYVEQITQKYKPVRTRIKQAMANLP